MEQGSLSHEITEHNPDLHHPHLLELPLAALRNIALTLDTDDRKTIALTCKPLCNIVRQLWSTVSVNIYGGYDDSVPQGLSRFSGVDTIIWTDYPVAKYEPEEHGDWDSDHEGYNDSKVAHWEIPNGDALARLTVVNELLYRAINPERTATTPRSLCLILGNKSKIDGDELCYVLVNTLPPSFHLNLPHLSLEEGEEGEEMPSIAQESAELITRGMQEFGSGFWRLQEEDEEQVNVDDVVRQAAAAILEDLQINPDAMPDAALDILKMIVQEQPAAPRQPAVQGVPCMQGDLPQRWAEVERKRYRINKTMYLNGADANMLPYSEVKAGWYSPDGYAENLVSRCSVDWCYHVPLDRVDFESNAEKLRELRFRVNYCQVADGTAINFQREICPRINTLTSLQQLYFGRPNTAEECLPLDPRALQLPSLTRLVLNEYIGFEEFEHFTHLTALESLSITMPALQMVLGHAQDLLALQALPNLTSLTVNDWCVEHPQDLSCLTKLTELSLTNLKGIHTPDLDVSVPMPNLIDVTITKVPLKYEVQVREDSSEFTKRWALNTARLFPNAEVLQLGLWMKVPELKIVEKLEAYATYVVDELLSRAVLSKARDLRYFQFDCILNITSEKLEKRCRAGAITLENTVDVQLKRNAAGNASFSASAVDQGNRREVRRWERSVEFVPSRNNILVAEFHYSLVKEVGCGHD